MRVLGVDPGLRLTGYGCVEGQPRRPRIVEAGVIRLVGSSEGSPRPVIERLEELDHDFRNIIHEVQPEAVAVEALFAHYRHPATAIVMGHARGVLLLAVRAAGLPLIELAPKEVKKSMTGFGGAGKGQMQRAVQQALGLEQPPRPADVADALAIAMCARDRLASGIETVGTGQRA
ncbi:MAG: crossover junction endodeoxyribonuclease RuvC [Planctomycetota bacterium]